MKTIFSLIITVVLTQTVCQSQIHYVQDMTTTQIDALDKEKTVVLLPGGILEEHGPYLPAFTDGYFNQRITQDVAATIVRKGWNALIFPLIPLGTGGANEIGRKYNHSGTYAIRQSTLRAIFMDLASEVGEQGFKTILVIHLHGSPNHNQAIEQACDYFTDTYKGRMISVNNLPVEPVDIKFRQDLRTESERKEDGFTVHGGIMEHSMLYYSKPDFKNTGYKQAKPVTVADPNGLVTAAKEKDWPGYFGSPRLASAELGEKFWKMYSDFATRKVEQILDNKYTPNKLSSSDRMSQNPVFKSVNEDARAYEKQLEAKQNAWLQSKGIE